MSRIKYFINHYEPGARDLAEQMRLANIDFASIPTSGCSTIWLDGRAAYGMTFVRYTILAILKHPKEYCRKEE